MDLTSTLAIGVPVFGGLAWVAYKHPKAYGRLFWVIMGLCFLWSIYALGTTVGASLATGKLLPMIPADQAVAAKKMGENAGRHGWAVVGPIGALFLWNMFLFSFPMWLIDSEKPKGGTHVHLKP
ncbi:hypothetical protein [Brevundimonas sp.]|uniref:hypothetical protein n=1 Tax=Brevundimonas sp. TaxID=1871086 RepID=UPI00289A1A01|nr:hypothetical protein [Brevundimonas sp.]